MKISVDTDRDHPNHIMQVIGLLQSVINAKEPESSVIYNEDAPQTQAQPTGEQPSIFSLFDDNKTDNNEPEEKEDEEETNDDSSYKITEEKREPAQPEEVPMVVEYDID